MRFSLPGFWVAVALSGAGNAVLENARLHPEDFKANHLAGEYLLSRKDLRGAIPYLQKAWKIDSADYANGFDLALAYLETGAAAESHEIVSSLLKRSDTAELHDLLGEVEEAEGRVNEAAHQYEVAARMDPSEKNVFDLGSDLLKHRGFVPALTTLQFGVKRYPASARLRVAEGIAFYSLGRYPEAVQSLCEAVDLDPRDAKALDFLGKMVDISPQSANEVSRRLAHFAAIYPENSAAHYYYALSLRKRTEGSSGAADQHSAELELLKATRLKPDFVDAHFQLGLLYEDEGRGNDAIRQYELAAKYQPDLFKAHYRLARLYQQAGRPALSRHEFDRLKTLKEDR